MHVEHAMPELMSISACLGVRCMLSAYASVHERIHESASRAARAVGSHIEMRRDGHSQATACSDLYTLRTVWPICLPSRSWYTCSRKSGWSASTVQTAHT